MGKLQKIRVTEDSDLLAEADGAKPAVARIAAAIFRQAEVGDHKVTGVARLAGGTRKGVYRLSCAESFSAVLYFWTGTEDYWPTELDDAMDGVFAHATGIGLFATSAARLRAVGVRIPRVYLVDCSQAVYPADIALVEDVRGGTLEELLTAEPLAAESAMARLGAMLASMRESRADYIGKAGTNSRPADSVNRLRCEQIVLERAYAVSAAPLIASPG